MYVNFKTDDEDDVGWRNQWKLFQLILNDELLSKRCFDRKTIFTTDHLTISLVCPSYPIYPSSCNDTPHSLLLIARTMFLNCPTRQRTCYYTRITRSSQYYCLPLCWPAVDRHIDGARVDQGLLTGSHRRRFFIWLLIFEYNFCLRISYLSKKFSLVVWRLAFERSFIVCRYCLSIEVI